MLIGDFFKINITTLSEDNKKTIFNITLNPEHLIFKGHFPGNPIAPGVCLTQIITDLIGKIEGCVMFLKSADYLKFINIVNPLEHCSLNVEIKIINREKEYIKAECIIFADSLIFFKSKGVYSQNL